MQLINVFMAYRSDGDIKIVTLSDNMAKTLRVHDGPILSLTFDPEGEFLVRKPHGMVCCIN